jgi:hypothetical protein
MQGAAGHCCLCSSNVALHCSRSFSITTAALALLPCVSCATCSKAATTKYTGPVPIVTHLHGNAGVQDNSDGYTEAWYLPEAVNLAGFAKVAEIYSSKQHLC